MSQITLPPAQTGPQTSDEAIGRKLTRWGWHIFATLAWLYLILKVFVFDLDSYLIGTYLPAYAAVPHYKFVIILGILGLSAVFFRRGQIISFVSFVAFYPFIICFFLLIYIFLNRSWMALVALSNIIVSFFQGFRLNVFTFAAYVVAYALILTFDEQEILWPSMLMLLMLVYFSYLKQIFNSFRTSNLVKMYDKLLMGGLIEQIKAQTKKQLEGLNTGEISKFDNNQLMTYRNSLQTVLLTNSGRLFVANILKEYKNSGFTVLSGGLSVIALLAETIIAFAAINYAAFKIDINAFNYTEFPSYFSFFHYSFFTMLFMSVKELTPSTKMANVLDMLQVSLMALMTLVLASQIISFRRQKFIDDIDSIIIKIKNSSTEIEKYILEEFRIDSFEKALEEVRKLESSMIGIILYLSKGRE